MRCNNRYSIDYIPNGDDAANLAEAQRFFSNLLTAELHLRHLPLYGSVEEQRGRLRNLLVVEQNIEMISQAISRGEEGKEAAMIL